MRSLLTALLIALPIVAFTGCVATVVDAPPPAADATVVCDCSDAGDPDAGMLWGCVEGTRECVQVACADWPERTCPSTEGGAGAQGGAGGADAECDCHPWKTCTWTEPGCEHMRPGSGGAGGGG
jgi:hypothetical protein